MMSRDDTYMQNLQALERGEQRYLTPEEPEPRELDGEDVEKVGEWVLGWLVEHLAEEYGLPRSMLEPDTADAMFDALLYALEEVAPYTSGLWRVRISEAVKKMRRFDVEEGE